MQPFKTHTGIVAPLQRENVDTDQIIPKQFLKRTERTGYGDFLFFDWRYDGNGRPNAQFSLNQPAYRRATILLAGKNFGCGSSREHAVWALRDYGFRAVIASSFADIFSTNCVKNGIVPVALSPVAVVEFMARAFTGSFSLKIDLEQCTVAAQDGFVCSFQMDPFQRACLLEGTDEIGATLKCLKQIEDYEKSRHTFLNRPVVDNF
ncbi:MAG TPA: 3-isopropylmalate dehydratase small subunit [Candidatus Angelobacter sp.]|jgi:3-isopropylmalate/(R)-2-methylmalate dehydratase small subunit|nr:3-isopropylmalate dehydratase small subunit [Candidatus Angelobacter sp.]